MLACAPARARARNICVVARTRGTQVAAYVHQDDIGQADEVHAHGPLRRPHRCCARARQGVTQLTNACVRPRPARRHSNREGHHVGPSHYTYRCSLASPRAGRASRRAASRAAPWRAPPARCHHRDHHHHHRLRLARPSRPPTQSRRSPFLHSLRHSLSRRPPRPQRRASARHACASCVRLRRPHQGHTPTFTRRWNSPMKTIT